MQHSGYLHARSCHEARRNPSLRAGICLPGAAIRFAMTARSPGAGICLLGAAMRFTVTAHHEIEICLLGGTIRLAATARPGLEAARQKLP